MNRLPHIYFLTPDVAHPVGGIKILYHHVDILNRNGIPAFILHQKDGFRVTWFENQTPIIYASNLKITFDDMLVIPECAGPSSTNYGKGIPKVVFNQNCYYTFDGYSLDRQDLLTPYLSPDIRAAIVVSEDSERYLRHVFPALRIHRVHNGIDPHRFAYRADKRKQIAFMPRKHPEDIRQVINILKFRNALADFELVAIDGKSEQETAEILQQSAIFLSFGYPEGFSLPPAEAMACGCVVIGFHGQAGREFMQPTLSFPINEGDILGFASTVEAVIRQHATSPDTLTRIGKAASDFITTTYSLQREERDVVSAWTDLISSHHAPVPAEGQP